MDDILRFLLHQASFLYKEYGFRFVDSQVTQSFGGDAFLVLATENIRFRIVRDRGQLFGDFQSAKVPFESEWFGIDIVRKQITDDVVFFAELNADNAAFLYSRFRDIEQIFSQANFSEARKKLHKLEAERAKVLFAK